MRAIVACWAARPKRRSKLQSNPYRNWVPPKQGNLRINVRGFYLDGENEGTIVHVCHGSSSLLVDGFVRTVRAIFAVQTEVLALLETLEYFQSRSKATLELDLDQ